MTRVLFLIDTLARGGSEQSTLEIAKRFTRTSAGVCFPYCGNTLEPEFQAAGIPTFPLELNGKYDLYRAVRGVSRVVREFRPDIIHSTLFRSRLIGRAVSTLHRLPHVESFVNIDYGPARMRSLSPAARLKVRVIQAVDALTTPAMDLGISNTQEGKVAAHRSLLVSNSKLSVIHRGRDPEVFDPAQFDRPALRRALGIDPDQSLILSVGRLVPQKDFHTLLHAMAAVAQKHPNARLLIAGDGPDRPKLEALINRLGLGQFVTLLGFRSDVPALLAAADLFAFSTHHEGHAGAVIEAMMAGLPIVATDIPVLRESIEHNRTGLLVCPGDASSLAASLCELLERSTASELGLAARTFSMKQFTIAAIAGEQEALYAQL